MRLGQLHAVGGGQQQLRRGTPEGNQSHPVPALVGVQEQGEDGPLDRHHPPLGAHGAAGVDDEEYQASGFGLPHFFPHVPGFKQKGRAGPGGVRTPLGPSFETERRRGDAMGGGLVFAAASLIGSGRPQGGVQGQVGYRALGDPGAHVAPGGGAADRFAPPPGRLPGALIRRLHL